MTTTETTTGTALDELCDQHDPDALDGRRPEGQLRPPRRADGARAGRLPALHPRDEAQPRQRGLVRPRPLRALGGPRLDAALLDPPPVRLRPDASTTSRTSASSAARRPATPSTATRPGIEATTGPLGQGISNAVGLALAEAMIAARYNRDGHELIDHHTYTIASDGDLQEGVASEACSLAGHLGLGKLIAFYDDNKIQLAGPTVGRLLRGRRRSATRRTAGTCRTWARTSRSTTWSAPSTTAKGVGRPAEPDRRCAPTSARARRTSATRTRRTARRSARRRCA